MNTHSFIPCILLGALALSNAGEPVYPQPLTPEHNPWADKCIASNFGFGACYTRKNTDEALVVWIEHSSTAALEIGIE